VSFLCDQGFFYFSQGIVEVIPLGGDFCFNRIDIGRRLGQDNILGQVPDLLECLGQMDHVTQRIGHLDIHVGVEPGNGRDTVNPDSADRSRDEGDQQEAGDDFGADGPVVKPVHVDVPP